MSQAVIGNNSEVIFHFSIKLEDGSAADSTKVHNKPAKLRMGEKLACIRSNSVRKSSIHHPENHGTHFTIGNIITSARGMNF